MNIEQLRSADLWSLKYETITYRAPDMQRSHNRMGVVTGVSGSGKDFLLARAIGQMDEVNKLRIPNGGTLMSEYFGVPRDQLRTRISMEDLQEGREAISPLIVGDNSPALLNTHVVTKHLGELKASFKSEKIINPLHYVVIVSDPQRIEDWRQERNISGDRASDIESGERIQYHQKLVIDNVSTLAKYLGSGFSLVYNTPEQTENNVHFIKQILDSIR